MAGADPVLAEVTTDVREDGRLGVLEVAVPSDAGGGEQCRAAHQRQVHGGRGAGTGGLVDRFGGWCRASVVETASVQDGVEVLPRPRQGRVQSGT
ncbi:hypothetical protein [Corynebacterium glyciniphilum]|uniref:hypothetical protein n=1 Tax=Corynebacterium glyciniphilum TaxID=1404244 RepID=UPI003FD47865